MHSVAAPVTRDIVDSLNIPVNAKRQQRSMKHNCSHEYLYCEEKARPPEVLVPYLEPLLGAVTQGNLDETRRLYRKHFDTGFWELPADWKDDRKDPFHKEYIYVTYTLLPACLRRAARQQHWHIVDWIISDANQFAEARGEFSQYFNEEAVADELWELTTGKDGTIMHALQMCGKGWPQSRYEGDDAPREEYENRMWFDWDHEFGEFPHILFGDLQQVKRLFVWTKEWAVENPSIVIFKYSTPAFVCDMLAKRGHCWSHAGGLHLVSALIRCALKMQLKTHASRCLGIAEGLVDMGFEFKYTILFELAKYPQHRRLLLKMMRICGGIALVGRHVEGDIQAISKAHQNLILVWVAFKMRVLARRARERTWSPASSHVSRLKENFTANALNPYI